MMHLRAGFLSACSYDRAGAGFSDPGPPPRTSLRIAEESKPSVDAVGAKRR
jgi:hypothetical protein